MSLAVPGRQTPAISPERYLDSIGDTHSMVQFVCACHFGSLHFKQCHEKRERGFSSLIFVYTVWMKAIPASTCNCIIQRNLQIVLAEKPTEDSARFLKPLAFLRQPVHLKTGRNGCACLHWLLIEARLSIPFNEESVGSYRYKNLLIVTVLLGNQPLQRVHSSLNHSLVVTPPSCKNKRLREPCI